MLLCFEVQKGVDSILTHGSLFDGIGGFILPSTANNIQTIWNSEIDDNCNSLIHIKYKKIEQHGNICDVNGKNIKPVDIITFGSPCNNLSLAGNRKGLNGDESKLFYEAIRIIDEMRVKTDGEYPKFIIWENVTGALSSNNGEDFKRVLEEITKTNISIPKSNRWANAGMVRSTRCDVEWRVFDAQYWGVPQSRKRIFLVADFRANRGSCGEILFESQRLSRDTKKIKRDEKTTTTINENGIRTTGEGKQVISTIFAAYGTKWNGNNGAYTGSHFVLEKDGRLRRLTPLECERLFGFPDNWTKGFKDTVRYRMCGNSVVIPIVDWLYKRIIAINT